MLRLNIADECCPGYRSNGQTYPIYFAILDRVSLDAHSIQIAAIAETARTPSSSTDCGHDIGGDNGDDDDDDD